METFPSDINFKFEWRKYQERVLDKLDNHLDDNHLHIIAPPGSGKTILGLEVARRLNKPCLILTPSIAIRNQWIEKFKSFFTQDEIIPEWISKDLNEPSFLTLSTYQSLLSFFSKTDIEQRNDWSLLSSVKLGTIIIDEALHLKNDWWKPLTSLKKKLAPTIVGLTATPPYDVSYSEWNRYLELNGPIDAEITVPELIAEGDLCPHQDFIHLSYPSSKEQEIINKEEKKSQDVIDSIEENAEFKTNIKFHPAYANPLKELEWIYRNRDTYISILIFLNHFGSDMHEDHNKILKVEKVNLPKYTPQWLERLLDYYLFEEDDFLKSVSSHRNELLTKLKQKGVIKRNRVRIINDEALTKALKSSISKLHSIEEIVDIEYTCLGVELRLVILADYIRSEYLIKEKENTLEIVKSGVIPIFEKLRRRKFSKLKIGVLSGSIVLIPRSSLNRLQELVALQPNASFSYQALTYDGNYLQLTFKEKTKHLVVLLITQLFEEGFIQVLIGTKSLLGEGWDAPSTNSLILASFVGSYVLSNQMRGRAIRRSSAKPNKTGHIWHLASINPNNENGGQDIELLSRRFNMFVGLSHDKLPTIENGINRLQLPNKLNTVENIDSYNNRNLDKVKERELLLNKWNDALNSGRNLVHEMCIPAVATEKDELSINEQKVLYVRNSIKSFIKSLLSGIGSYLLLSFEFLLNNIKIISNPRLFAYILSIILALLFVRFGAKCLKAFWLHIKYRDIDKDILGIGQALLDTLISINIIQDLDNSIEVKCYIDDIDLIHCHLAGANNYEQAQFTACLKEILDPVDNPRYIILRLSKSKIKSTQIDYHSVPEVIGKNKTSAEFFAKRWLIHVGNCHLIYTRTLEGRQKQLKARIYSLHSQLTGKVFNHKKWRINIT
jgi:superfamily II DNA or RNA helicase